MKNLKKQIKSFLTLLAILSIKFFLISSFSVVLAQTSQGSHLEQDVFSTVGEIGYGESGEPKDIRIIVARIINVVLGLLATIFLILVVIAGFQWMTSGGNQEKTKSAMGKIKNALIGLIIISISWSISFFILRRLEAVTRGTNYLDIPNH